jgi:anti-sigma regulatory factor (Ser/Thr protein kinase)
MTAQERDAPPLAAAITSFPGLYYLDARTQRLYLLNETARRLHREGLPALGTEPTLDQLQTPTRGPVRAEDLPLPAAAREARTIEASFVLCRPGQPDCYLFWSATPLGDPGGRVTGVLGAVCSSPPEPDWHALAGLAHDLRTPLQTIRFLTAALTQEGMPADQQEEGLGLLSSAAERALQVGADLLEWSRTPIQGGRPVQANWLPLEPFLTGLLKEQEPAAERKGVALATNLAEARGWEALTDRVRLGRLLANLLTNAVRYTAAGGQVVLAASWKGEGEKRALALSVADTGAGIAPEEQEEIFEPFARGHAGRSDSSSGGSGLGLAIIDRLVGELGLRREFSSEYGRGSDFRVLLPHRVLRFRPGAAPDSESAQS